MLLDKWPDELVLRLSVCMGYEDMSVTSLAMTCNRFYALLIHDILVDEVSHLENMINTGKLVVCKDKERMHRISKMAPEEFYKTRFESIVIELPAVDKDLRCLKRLVVRAGKVDLIKLELGRYGSGLPPRSRARKMATIFNVCVEKEADVEILGYPCHWDYEPGPFSLLVLDDSGGRRTSRHLDTRRRSSHHYSVTGRNAAERRRYINPLMSFQRALDMFRLAKESFSSQITSTSSTIPPSVLVTMRKGKYEVPLIGEPRATGLVFASSVPFRASFARSTFSMLNNLHLTSLVLYKIDLSEYEWSAILARTNLPALSNFVNINEAIAYPDQRKFLARHPRISGLDLSGSLYQNSGTEFELPIKGIGRRFLPELDYLKGKPQYLTAFLRGGGGRFLKLSLVDVRLTEDKGTKFTDIGKRDNQHFFDALAGFGPQKLTLRVECLKSTNLVGWLADWTESNSRFRIRRPHTLPSIHKLIIGESGFDVPPELLEKVVASNNAATRGPPDVDDEKIVKKYLWRKCPNLQQITYSFMRFVSNHFDPLFPMVRKLILSLGSALYAGKATVRLRRTWIFCTNHCIVIYMYKYMLPNSFSTPVSVVYYDTYHTWPALHWLCSRRMPLVCHKINLNVQLPSHRMTNKRKVLSNGIRFIAHAQLA